MNRRRTWVPLRWMPLTATGAVFMPAAGVAPAHTGPRRLQRHPSTGQNSTEQNSTGHNASTWHNADARPSGGFRLESDLDHHIGNQLKHGNRQQQVGDRLAAGGTAGAGNAAARDFCSPAVDHCKLLELASEIAIARASRG